MTDVWGKLNGPTSIELKSSVAGEPISKSEIRQQVWDFFEEHDLANSPRPVYKHIPNFKGAATAGQTLTSLPEFKDANVMKVNPDKPQEEVRYQALDHKKVLFVPTPRLKSGLFNQMKNPGDCNKEFLRMLASRSGIDNHSTPVSLSSKNHIDVIVIGSVAVDKLGHRIGKGEGYADLEYAMGVSLGAITADTVVIATVHDCQLFDSLPEEIFGEHDITVDIIVTPTTVHRVEKRLPKPTRIIWKMLTAEKLRRIPVLKEMRTEDEKLGEDVELKAGTQNPGNVNRPEKEYQAKNYVKHKKESEEIFDERPMLYVGKIPRNARVRDLKVVMLERGIKPKELVWKGFKGYAFLYFDMSQDIEKVHEALSDLKVGDTILDVQREKYTD